MRILLVLALALAARLPIGQAQAALPDSTTIFNSLYQIPELDIEIEADFTSLQRNRKAENKEKGWLRILEGKEVVKTYEVELKTRGKMRKQTCSFPPIKIKFLPLPDDDSLADLQSLKLVRACNKNDDSEDLVIRECLMYDLYRELTDQSFRVKLANVKFKDSNKKLNTVRGSAFFIEPVEELAARLGGVPYSPKVMSPSGLDSAALDRMCLFQFMIGNTDWGVYSQHNLKLIRFAETYPVPVPYDFDYAGAVNAAYAIPDKRLPIATVRQRYYIGFCRSESTWQQTAAAFQAKKDDMMRICKEYPRLSFPGRTDIEEYLGSFFEILDTPKKMDRMVKNNCNNFKRN